MLWTLPQQRLSGFVNIHAHQNDDTYFKKLSSVFRKDVNSSVFGSRGDLTYIQPPLLMHTHIMSHSNCFSTVGQDSCHTRQMFIWTCSRWYRTCRPGVVSSGIFLLTLYTNSPCMTESHVGNVHFPVVEPMLIHVNNWFPDSIMNVLTSTAVTLSLDRA